MASNPRAFVPEASSSTLKASPLLIPIWKSILALEPSRSFTPLKLVFVAILSSSATNASNSFCIMFLSDVDKLELPACTANSRVLCKIFSISPRAPSAV